MPTYNYECLTCKTVMSLMQSMSEPAFENYKCEACNKKKKVRRIISGGSGMIFKGSGFYLTDYTAYGKKSSKVDSDSKKDDSKPKKKKEKKKKD